jgi:4a-hydroxytetrahydrobiopterin dehydratase
MIALLLVAVLVLVLLNAFFVAAEFALVRDLEFKDFAEAMAFVNRVAEAAEAANHHPDILIHGWNQVRLTLTTHSAGKLTDNDRAMSERIDGLPLSSSP